MKTTIELVRHAKAHSRDRWWGRPDRERPLTDVGMDQARALAAVLRDGEPIVRLFSSPWLRCTQTLDPLADQIGLQVVDIEELGEVISLPVHDGGDAWVTSAWLGGRAVAFINRVLAQHAGRRVVACSHGDVIPAVVALLVGRDGLDTADVRCRKGGRFTLEFDDERCVTATYSPPPM
ncbi:MAG TPA: histidine phosphatase family protein [Euzebya sp.]|nr:histidine phosphatase family protein [Euzebya sp.]